jgi:hypothetical protein
MNTHYCDHESGCNETAAWRIHYGLGLTLYRCDAHRRAGISEFSIKAESPLSPFPFMLTEPDPKPQPRQP